MLVKPRVGMKYTFIAFALLTWKITRGLIETHRGTAMHSVRLFIFLLAGLCLTVATGSSVPPYSIEKSSENQAAGVHGCAACASPGKGSVRTRRGDSILGWSNAQEFDSDSSGAQEALFAERNRTGRRSQS
jgi:hypothetical protein